MATAAINNGVVTGEVTPGGELQYQFELQNTGNIALTDIEVTSLFGTNWSCDGAELAPGETVVCSASHVLDILDLVGETLVNPIVVTASNTAGIDVTASESIRIAIPPQTEAVSDLSQWEQAPVFPDQAITGQWQFGTIEESTTSSGLVMQPPTGAGGADDTEALVTGINAGNLASANDIDGGSVTVWSPAVIVPDNKNVKVDFAWFFAHSSGASVDDRLTVSIVVIDENTETAQSSADLTLTQLFEIVGTPGTAREATWESFESADLSAFGGQTIRLFIEAVDDVSNSLTEAGFDEVTLTITDDARGR